jgi:CubicO group peptidase (beta-lactamase class C family)
MAHTILLPAQKLREQIPFWLDEMGISGVSIALVEDSKIVWAEGFGFRNRDAGLPVTQQTIFEAASISKPVFTLLVLQLVQSGLLDLNIPFTEYLPAEQNAEKKYPEGITARHVLSHTSGLPNWSSEKLPLRSYFTPGDHFSYSGEGYVYLQKIVEGLTGTSLEDLAQERIFYPLGMTSSSFTWQERFEPFSCIHYDRNGQPCKVRRETQSNAAYSLYSTPIDLSRYLAWMMGGSEPPLLAKEWVDKMVSHQVNANTLSPWNDAWPNGPYSPTPGVYWGLGWGVQRWEGEEGIFHWGDNGNAHAFAAGFLRSRCGMAAMSNSANGLNLWPRLFSSVFGGGMPAIDWLEGMYSR